MQTGRNTGPGAFSEWAAPDHHFYTVSSTVDTWKYSKYRHISLPVFVTGQQHSVYVKKPNSQIWDLTAMPSDPAGSSMIHVLNMNFFPLTDRKTKKYFQKRIKIVYGGCVISDGMEIPIMAKAKTSG